jgi:hypothetical protein
LKGCRQVAERSRSARRRGSLYKIKISLKPLFTNDIDRVCKYIKNQPIHHKIQTYAEETERFLKYYQRTLSLKK